MTSQQIMKVRALRSAPDGNDSIFKGEIRRAGALPALVSEEDNEWEEFSVGSSSRNGELTIQDASLENVAIQTSASLVFRNCSLFNVRIAPQLNCIGESSDDGICEYLTRRILIDGEYNPRICEDSENVQRLLRTIGDTSQEPIARLAALLPLVKSFMLANDMVLPKPIEPDRSFNLPRAFKTLWTAASSKSRHGTKRALDREQAISLLERLARTETNVWIRASAVLAISLLLPLTRNRSLEGRLKQRTEEALRSRIRGTFIGDVLSDPEPRIRSFAITSCPPIRYNYDLQNKLLEIFGHDDVKAIRQLAEDCLKNGVKEQRPLEERLCCLFPSECTDNSQDQAEPVIPRRITFEL